MIYITGDTHGSFFRIKQFCERMNTTKDDIMIILGDAGLNFWLNKSDYKRKKEVMRLPITLFMIHGNHEERPYLIKGYEEKEWHGGTVYVEPEFPRLIFAKDGEIYDFDGKKTVVIGGAYSIDKQYRITHHVPWFESEQPNDEIKAYVEEQLTKADWKVDVVLSHTAPVNYEPRHLFMKGINQALVDKTTEKWLQEIEYKLDYKKWYFGHYHGEWIKGRMQMLFEDIIEFLGDEPKDINISKSQEYEDLFLKFLTDGDSEE